MFMSWEFEIHFRNREAKKQARDLGGLGQETKKKAEANGRSPKAMTGLAALFLPPLESQCLGCHTSDLLDGNLHQPREVHYRISTKNPRDNPKAQILALFKKLRYHKWHIIWVNCNISLT